MSFLFPFSTAKKNLLKKNLSFLLNQFIYHLNKKVAVSQGFEPWKGFHLCRFSRPVLSTTQPTHLFVFYFTPCLVSTMRTMKTKTFNCYLFHSSISEPVFTVSASKMPNSLGHCFKHAVFIMLILSATVLRNHNRYSLI